jgi:hypothetical protein
MRSGTVVEVRDGVSDTGGGEDNKDRVNWVIIQHDGGYALPTYTCSKDSVQKYKARSELVKRSVLDNSLVTVVIPVGVQVLTCT